MKLTPHFTFKEATKSAQFPGLVEDNEKYAKQPHVFARLVMGAWLLEEMREAIGEPLEVHSWCRCPALNDAVEGAPSSQHVIGEGFDFSPLGPDTEASMLAAWDKMVVWLARRNLMFGQLIRETRPGRWDREHWFHMSLGYPFRMLYISREFLTYTDGKYANAGSLRIGPWLSAADAGGKD